MRNEPAAQTLLSSGGGDFQAEVPPHKNDSSMGFAVTSDMIQAGGPPSHCGLCPRQCGVDRRKERGFCRAGERVQVYTCGPHHGEEPPISGQRGSGTVFFSCCTMRCLYCQNYPWSQQGQGVTVDEAALVAMFSDLVEHGVHNWNLVSPTPWLPQITAALDALRRRDLRLPVVYNTSGFETLNTLTAMDEYVDVYLTDLRYASAATAAGASSAPDYVETARAALTEMWRQKGPLQCDDRGIARRGVICRILVLPGHHHEALESLQWLAKNIGVDIAVSVMAQYTPAWQAASCEPWDRGLTEDEYTPVAEAVGALGFTTGWIQDLETRTPPPLIGYNMPAIAPAAVAG